ncbi:hypothetical protein [Sphingobacterium griseoflavum]|uniref:Uncharacterized protein n=1 Tax=Sphingobacterium griseoflavum TaxID=1474952 RepID=A0ABQ3HSE1_9SPHI|nr:hypothetical protein [Sphingobacterium griseoflavum]GHE23371.1 hypothetical protein GCM10017764_03390 [Sphingobacterium griseoflavum]
MEHKDPQLRKLMKLSKMELPFSDFEDHIMAEVEKIEAGREEALKHRKLALIFFITGSLFGLILNYMVDLAMSHVHLQQGAKNLLSLCSQLCYVILIVLLSDRLWRLRQLLKRKL